MDRPGTEDTMNTGQRIVIQEYNKFIRLATDADIEWPSALVARRIKTNSFVFSQEFGDWLCDNNVRFTVIGGTFTPTPGRYKSSGEDRDTIYIPALSSLINGLDSSWF